MLRSGFFLLTVVLAVLYCIGVYAAVAKAYPDSRRRRSATILTAVTLFLWLVYVAITTLQDIFLVASFPPRIPVMLMFPLVLFMCYFFLSKRFRAVIDVVPLQWVIYMQTFRIAMALLLFGMFMENLASWSARFEGYNFDIGIGISAPIIGYLASLGRLHKWFLRLWNIMGLITLFVVMITLNTYAYRPWIFNEPATILGKGFGTFPFTYMAGLFLPTALFLHIFTFVKMRRMAGQENRQA